MASLCEVIPMTLTRVSHYTLNPNYLLACRLTLRY